MIRKELSHLAVDLSDLKPHPENVRQGDVGAITESLKHHGQYRPIVVQKSTGHILAGNHTFKAAKALKWKQIAATYVDCDDEQALRILLMDNRANDLASYDDNALAEMLKALMATDQKLDGTGFDPSDLDELLGQLELLEPAGIAGDPDNIPESAPAKTVPGDVWLLGPHRLMCGDSTSPTDVSKLMAGNKATLCHADPPYGMGKEKDGVLNDNLYADKLDQFQMQWWAACRPFLEDNASAYIWGNVEDLWRLWFNAGLSRTERMTFRNEILWHQVTGVSWGKDGMSGLRSYATMGERCLFFMLGEQGFNNNADNYWDGWEPIRSYLETEMKRCGWTVKDLNKITSTQMAGHWVTKSQWAFITEEHYAKIQKAAQDHDAFKQDHDALKQDHDALKQDFYSTRAYFDSSHDKMTDIWEYERVTGEERHGHATPKPVAMIERAIKSSAPTESIVLEPFGGSGSTLIAAHQTNRIAYLMELDPHYCDVICARYQKATGVKPIAEATGNEHDFLTE